MRLGNGYAAAIFQMFQRLQDTNRAFFYYMDVNDLSRLCNVMWVHPRSRAAYEEFSDAVSFDTTYRVNK